NFERNTHAYSLLLLLTSRVFDAAAPRVLISLASSSNLAAIKDIIWMDDDETILFLGQRPDERTQLYSVNCNSGELKRITNHPTNLTAFVRADKGNRLAYVAET